MATENELPGKNARAILPLLEELAEKDAEIERLRGALITGASMLEQGCNAADMAVSMRRVAAAPNLNSTTPPDA